MTPPKSSDSRSTPAADVEAVRRVALPLHPRGETFDPAPIVALLGEASIVGLGEPTHGDAVSLLFKRAIIEAVARTHTPALIAWERGVGSIAHIASLLLERGEVPPDERRWFYPWVSVEGDALLRWIGDAMRSGHDAIALCGVDMDGLAPPAVFETLCASYGNDADGPLAALRDAAAVTRRDPPDEALTLLMAAADEVLAARPDLRPADRLIVVATHQWARFMLLARDADPQPPADGKLDPSEFRDASIAQNLLEERRIHRPRIVLFSAHNGHVSRDAFMAGGHVARAAGSDYIAIGMAFGRGRFNAGTAKPEGGFDRKLTEFEAEPPPDGTMEALLGKVGLPAFALDLRPLRGTGHPLARDMRLREVSLAGGGPQFELTRTPADYYDILVWIESIRPSRILRDKGFW